MWNISNKWILLTGSTSGIGMETAKGIARLGGNLILPVRNITKGENIKMELLKINPKIIIDIFEIDLSSFESVKDCSQKIYKKYKVIDVIINNAGGIFNGNEVSIDGINLTYQINHYSHFLLTLNLLPSLKKAESSRIINVSSGVHYQSKLNIDSNFVGKENAMNSYANSKLMNVLFAKSLATKLKDTKINTYSLHPGLVKTNFGKTLGLISIFFKLVTIFGISSFEGAKTSIYLASSKEVSESSGEYFDRCKAREPLQNSKNEELQDKLWKTSEKLTQIYRI